MKQKIVKCRKISKGRVTGEVIVTRDSLSFLGGVDPNTGIVIDSHHELYGRKISGKILVMPSGKGSTVGSYVLYQMYKNKTAPLGIIALEAEPIIATGAIMAGISMVDQPKDNIFDLLKDGDVVELDADACYIKFIEK
jgi:predicted aconitase with swiveling domain